MNDLLDQWTATHRFLEEARSFLPGCSDPDRLRWYGEFLEHNELESALEQLELAARGKSCSPCFWRALLSASESMGLDDHSCRFADALRQAEELAG
ncbi:MAG: hypothetical protein DCC71_24605 [Proteobacteria bacterium]|nr:MAG: hypothetical protein DCC71_24605 [Pseudomonadota bacterium]